MSNPTDELPVVNGDLETASESDQTQEDQRAQHEHLKDGHAGRLALPRPMEPEGDETGRHRAQEHARAAVGLRDGGCALRLEVVVLRGQQRDPSWLRVAGIGQPKDLSRRNG